MSDPVPSTAVRPPAQTWATFLLLSAVWGSSYLFIEIALAGDVAPLTLAALRTALGALFLGGVFLLRGGARPRNADAWRRFTVLGLTNVAVPFVLIIWGQQSITSGMAGILSALVPLFTVVLASLVLLDEALTLNRLAGLLIGFVGVVLLSLPSLGAATQGADGVATLLGMLALVASAVIYAVGVVYAKRQLDGRALVRDGDGVARPSTIVELSFWQIAIAIAILAVAAVVFERPAGGLFAWPSEPQAWVALVWLGVLGTGVAYVLFFRVVRAWGATRASLVTYVIPPIAILLGFVVLDERFEVIELLGTALIIGGIVVVNARPARALAADSGSA